MRFDASPYSTLRLLTPSHTPTRPLIPYDSTLPFIPLSTFLEQVDTFSRSKENETPNRMSQLAMILTTKALIAMKITAQVDSSCSDLHVFSSLEWC